MFLSQYDIMDILVCPPAYPILETFTVDDQGDSCYHDSHRGFHRKYDCPGKCVLEAGAPWCKTSDFDNSPCRISGTLLNYIEILLRSNHKNNDVTIIYLN